MKRKIWFSSLAFTGCLLIMTISCSKKSDTPESTVPVLTTTNVTSITETTAASGGNVTSSGGTAVIASGVCWSTAANPTLSDSKTIDGTGTGVFSSEITGLTGNTLYYVRAYATNSSGTAYGDQRSFTTQPPVIPAFTVSFNTVTLQGGGAGLQFFAKCINDDIKMTKVDILDPIHPSTITYNMNGQTYVKDQLFGLQDAGIAYPKTTGSWRFDFYGTRTATGKGFHIIITLTVSKK
jgi:hypothetical protein